MSPTIVTNCVFVNEESKELASAGVATAAVATFEANTVGGAGEALTLVAVPLPLTVRIFVATLIGGGAVTVRVYPALE